jgi:hypothetical protein
MRHRTLLRAGTVGLLAGVATRRQAAATKATFASVNTAAYINPRMQLRFIEEVWFISPRRPQLA